MGPVAAGVALTAKYVAKKPIESYDRKDKQRANNPPVGLVTPATDPDAEPAPLSLDDLEAVALRLREYES